ncbi:hypothetical protein Tco_0593998 [Tanacetum coccineum]
MASLDYRLNPLFTIRECSSCGALYNKSCGCSKGGLIDKFVRDPNKTPDSSQRPPILCVKCGNPVEGPSCQGCALWRKKLKEVWFTTCHENGINQDLLNTFESSNDDTNIVNAPREPFVVKQDPGENSSQSPPQINHNCCYECGDSLDGIFCQQCTCKSCGKGAHIGYNCPPKALIISNPEPCNQTIDELPQTLPSFDTTCYSEKENSLPYISKPNFVMISKVFTHSPHNLLSILMTVAGETIARYGHYITSTKVDQIDDEVLENTNSIPPGNMNIFFKMPNPIFRIFVHRDTSINDSQKIDSFIDSSPRNTKFYLPPEVRTFHVDYPDLGDSIIDVVEDIPVDVPNILPTHLALQLDFDFIPSNDLGSDLNDSSPSGDSNKIYDPGICIEDCPDSEASRARDFCPSITRASSPQLHLGIRYPNLIN